MNQNEKRLKFLHSSRLPGESLKNTWARIKTQWENMKQIYVIHISNKVFEVHHDGGDIDVNHYGGRRKIVGKDDGRFVATGITLEFKTTKYPTKKKILNYIKDELLAEDYDYVIEGVNGKMYGLKQRKENAVGRSITKNKYYVLKLKTLLRVIDYEITGPFSPTMRFNDLPARGGIYNDYSIGTNINFVFKYTINEFKDLCVINCIEEFLKSKTRESLRYGHNQLVFQFCEIKGFKSNDNIERIKYLQENGITSNDILKFTMEYCNSEISLIIISPLNEVIVKQMPIGAHDCLCLKINNGHCYLIVDSEIKSQLKQINKIKNNTIEKFKLDTFDECDITNFVKTIENGVNDNIIVRDSSWVDVVHAYMNNYNTMITTFDTSSKGIRDFICEHDGKNKIISIRTDYLRVNKYLTTLKTCDIEFNGEITKYRGQSISSIHSDLEGHFIGDIPHSKFNINCLNHIRKFKQPRLLEYDNDYEYIDEEDIDELKLCGIDIFKAHSYARCNLLDDIPLFDIHNKIEKYNGGDIECGLYRIESCYLYKNKHIQIPEAFYTSGFVKKMLENNIITKDNIIEQYLSNAKMDKNILQELTKFIFETFNNDDAKFLSNIGTGMFGRIYNKSLNGFFTTDCDTAHCNMGDGFKPVSINDKYYFSRKMTRTLMRENHLPVYYSIIQSSIWRLYEIMNEYCNVNSKIHGIRVDCFYGTGFNKLPDISNLTNYEKLGYPQLNKYNPHVGIEYEKEKYPLFVKNKFTTTTNTNLLEMKGCLIKGMAGAGKTHLLIETLKELKSEEYLVLTPTNKSKDRLIKDGVKCETIDSSLITNIDGVRCEKYKYNEFKYNYLFVDEIYSCSSFHINLIYNIYLKNPELKIYLFGGKEQTLCIENSESDNKTFNTKSVGVIYDYDESQALIDMCKNVLHLQYVEKTGRYDRRLYDESMKLLNNEVPELQLDDGKCDITICKTNRMVDLMNKKMMDKIKNGDEFTLLKQKVGCRSLLTKMILEKGSPVVPYKNKKNVYYNNEEFEYLDCDEKTVNLIRLSNKQILNLKINEFVRNFIVSYSGTVNRFQGSKIDKKYCVMEINRMTKNDIYTAITRATKYKNVFINEKINNNIREYKYEKCKKISIKNKYTEGFIYKIVNNFNNDIYIGKTKNSLETRLNKHFTTGIRRDDEFTKFIKLHNENDFKIELIEIVHFKNENTFINKYKDAILKYIPLYHDLKYIQKLKKPVIKKINKQLKGISFDKRSNAYRVRLKNIKAKTFSIKKFKTKENAYEHATLYLHEQGYNVYSKI